MNDSPLGPFKYMENSSFSINPGGYIGCAGHRHTFKDKYGNYWHVASMKISKRHRFERRIGLFPVYFDESGGIYTHTVWSDYRFEIPSKAVDFSTNNCSLGWNLLSYNKQSSASSLFDGYGAANANDETVETWWSAQTGNAGEWWQVDLGKNMMLKGIQVNFADMDFTNKASGLYICYQYKIECSENGKSWETLIDKTQNTADSPHELIVLDAEQKTRYLRITNTKNMVVSFHCMILEFSDKDKEIHCRIKCQVCK